jgi:Arc/MetJ-type ribon-helix-helix transcriptional regulator
MANAPISIDCQWRRARCLFFKRFVIIAVVDWRSCIMTKRLALTKQDEELIEKHLSTGQFADAADVVRTGLEILDSIQGQRERWLREDISRRLDEAERDPVKMQRLDTVFRNLESRHRDRLSSDPAGDE